MSGPYDTEEEPMIPSETWAVELEEWEERERQRKLQELDNSQVQPNFSIVANRSQIVSLSRELNQREQHHQQRQPIPSDLSYQPQVAYPLSNVAHQPQAQPTFPGTIPQSQGRPAPPSLGEKRQMGVLSSSHRRGDQNPHVPELSQAEKDHTITFDIVFILENKTLNMTLSSKMTLYGVAQTLIDNGIFEHMGKKILLRRTGEQLCLAPHKSLGQLGVRDGDILDLLSA